jgi:hypothetical protein
MRIRGTRSANHEPLMVPHSDSYKDLTDLALFCHVTDGETKALAGKRMCQVQVSEFFLSAFSLPS